ncbi:MAG TPA: protein kinase, partial [Ktedonobacteraceae bacterium]
MHTTPRYLGKYELLERLGYGGIAEVWKTLDTQLQRFVAIKLLQPNLRDDPQFISRFQAEARMIASLHHPNIVQIHDFQVYQPEDASLRDAPIAYMVMDYVEGQTLAGYIRATSNQGKFPSSTELVNLFTSISLAIDYAHRHNMIHRDIKPANILLDMRNTTINPMGEPILTDFGVAKLLSSTPLTLSEARLGTPLYTSPEQANGYPGNERSDLYALGVILYELTTGAMPFRGDTPHDVIMQHMSAMPPAPELINPRISLALSRVIMRSLAKEPTRRYPSAAAMTIAVAEALHVPTPESLNVAFATKPDIPRAPTAYIPVEDGEPTVKQPSGRPSITPALAQSGPEWVITSSGKTASPASPPPRASAPRERRRRFYIASLAVVVALLLISAVGAFFYLP